VNSAVLRTFYYDSNPLDGSFSQNTQGRLAAVQHAGSGVQFAEMYSYTAPGLPSAKRLQVKQTVVYDSPPITDLTATPILNLDSGYSYEYGRAFEHGELPE
jgi:hypothetical protein